MDTVIRAAVIYGVLLILIRLSGRRTLAQMTAFDLVLVLIIAETTQQALVGDDFSITNAVVLMVSLVTIDIMLAFIKQRWPRAALWMDGAPTVLVVDGKPDRRALSRTRMQVDDVLEAARSQHGLERLDQIRFAVLEVGGNVSIVPAES